MSNKAVSSKPASNDHPTGGLEAVADDPDAMMAMVIGMAARNGIEDLHAAGAFSDRQAPSFNRRVRGRVYEALLALRYREQPGGGAFEDYLADLLEQTGTADPLEAIGEDALAAAVRRAVREFAAAEALDSQAARDLEVAATTTAQEDAIRPMRSADEESKKQLAYLAWMVPSYWEAPTVSDGFSKLLDTVTV